MKPTESISSIIDRAEEVLRIAYCGLDMMKSNRGSEKNIGLRNVLTFSRSVTWVIQNIRGKDVRFETWYEKHQKRMQNDRVFSYFRDARNNLEKQGRIETAVSATIIVTPEDWRAIDLTKPPGAEDFFLADHLGGSGWDIPLPNGEKLKYYVNLPESVAKIDIFFSGDLANKFLSENHQSTIELAKYILDELGKIVDDARTFFLLQEPSQTYSGKRLPPFLKVIK